jgi:hypothetical protein
MVLSGIVVSSICKVPVAPAKVIASSAKPPIVSSMMPPEITVWPATPPELTNRLAPLSTCVPLAAPRQNNGDAAACDFEFLGDAAVRYVQRAVARDGPRACDTRVKHVDDAPVAQCDRFTKYLAAGIDLRRARGDDGGVAGLRDSSTDPIV